MMIIYVILFLYCTVRVESADCVPKSYGSGKLVCVCNSTYCDDFPQINTISDRTAVVITSSQNGLRFSHTEVPFTPKNGLLNFLTQLTITVDPSVTYQEIIGFGGAFTDSAGINIASLSPGAQDNFINAYFSDKGLEYTTGRVPIASTDFSTRIYSYNDVSGDFALNNFQLAYEDLQYKMRSENNSPQSETKLKIVPLCPFKSCNINKTRINLARRIHSRANCWMKYSGKMSGPGVLKGNSQYQSAYANYLVRFFQEYANKGVNFWGLSSQNEPTSGYVPLYPWQTMGFTGQSQRDFIKNYLGPALKANSETENLKLMILDDNRSFLIFPVLPSWADIIFSDATSNQYVHGTGVHWYSNKFSPASLLSQTYQKYPDKFILATEACTGTDQGSKGPSMGDWSRAEAYAADIITDLNNFVSGWTDWNLCLNPQGGPTWVPNYVDSPIIVNATADEFYKQPMFYAMGHFSKFMRPGSRRINITAPNVPGLAATGTLDSAGRRVITILNQGIIDVNIEVLDATKPQSTVKLTISSHSIVTLLWN